MRNEITLVDRGRGLQLSTNRITVHDLVPYFQNGCSEDEIIRWVPSLTHDEIAIVERYYREHRDDLDDRTSRSARSPHRGVADGLDDETSERNQAARNRSPW